VDLFAIAGKGLVFFRLFFFERKLFLWLMDGLHDKVTETRTHISLKPAGAYV
jgi:hypothetical protein